MQHPRQEPRFGGLSSLLDHQWSDRVRFFVSGKGYLCHDNTVSDDVGCVSCFRASKAVLKIVRGNLASIAWPATGDKQRCNA
jgi:hypothetical protein